MASRAIERRQSLMRAKGQLPQSSFQSPFPQQQQQTTTPYYQPQQQLTPQQQQQLVMQQRQQQFFQQQQQPQMVQPSAPPFLNPGFTPVSAAHSAPAPVPVAPSVSLDQYQKLMDRVSQLESRRELNQESNSVAVLKSEMAELKDMLLKLHSFTISLNKIILDEQLYNQPPMHAFDAALDLTDVSEVASVDARQAVSAVGSEAQSTTVEGASSHISSDIVKPVPMQVVECEV